MIFVSDKTVGIADVVKLYNQPLAFGGYVYINHEDADYYVLNTDLRFATVLSYFNCDFLGFIMRILLESTSDLY